MPYLELCESPIERRLAKALAFAIWPGTKDIDRFHAIGTLAGAAVQAVIDAEDEEAQAMARLASIADVVQIEPQAKVLSYRLDFLVTASFGVKDRPPCRLGVECDGAEFHTGVDQRVRDWERQSEIEATGLDMIRFTGSQIFHEAHGCARVVVIILGDLDLRRRGLERFSPMVVS